MDIDTPNMEKGPAGEIAGTGVVLDDGDPFAADPYANLSPKELQELLDDPDAALSGKEVVED